MDDRRTMPEVTVPTPRAGEPIQVTCSGTGSPPLPVLARVSHVFCGRESEDVWAMFRRELVAGSVAAGELVLLRIGRGGAETWTELVVRAGD